MLLAMSPEQIDKVIGVLYKARTEYQVRLRYGLRHRQRLIETIQAHQPTDDPAPYLRHPRYVWVKETREALLNLMGERAKAYSQARPHDAISVADMTDTVEGMMMWLQNLQNS